jgi:transitional endoplasmic reticulum ATPase
MITIKPIDNLPNLTKIHVLPFSDTIEGITGSLTEAFLIPYFKEAFRPVKK